MGRVLPILFNTEMVQVILEGRKTATRRICKDGSPYSVPDMGFYDTEKRTYAVHNYSDKEHHCKLSIGERRCPVCADDILYVRETWAFIPCIGCNGEYARPGAGMNCYDTQAVEYDDGYSISDGCFVYRADCRYPERITWRPSIHMPKAAARIWLKVTDVRVERLQEMNADDLKEEGFMDHSLDDLESEFDRLAVKFGYEGARNRFALLWDSTIPRGQQDLYGWEANPWVWVIGFERCGNPEEQHVPSDNP